MAQDGIKARVQVKGVDSGSFVGVFVERARVAADGFTRAVGQELKDYIETVIREQRYKWQPLSRDYLASKERRGLDPRIYIATGFFLSNIKIWEDGAGIHVGFEPDAVHTPSGLKLNVLARILEFGSAKARIPARPLWRPAISAIRRRQKDLQRRLRISAARSVQEAAKKSKKIKIDMRGKG